MSFQVYTSTVVPEERYQNVRTTYLLVFNTITRTFIFVESEPRSPIVSDRRVEEIRVASRTRPAPALVDLTILVFHVEVVVFAVLVEEIRGISFHVRIDDRHQLAAFGCEIFHHLKRLGELDGIPSKISKKENVESVEIPVSR